VDAMMRPGDFRVVGPRYAGADGFVNDNYCGTMVKLVRKCQLAPADWMVSLDAESEPGNWDIIVPESRLVTTDDARKLGIWSTYNEGVLEH